MSTTATEFETRTSAASNRFDGIKRDYSIADVERLSGSVRIEHTLARNGANKLWERLHTKDYVHSLGAMTVTRPCRWCAPG